MEVSVMARAQHVRAFLIAPGVYRVHSKSTAAWHVVSAAMLGRHVRIVCDCPAGFHRKDQFGSSLCKHGAAVAARLLRRRPELLAVKFPQAVA